MKFIPSSNSMGLLLVFFPEDHKKGAATDAAGNFISSLGKTIRRSNSNLLATKAQSTISICVLLVFLTLLLFTLSTFEPTISAPAAVPRRLLTGKNSPISKPKFASFSNWVSKYEFKKSTLGKKQSNSEFPFALQGMGTLFRRGTRRMNDLVVANVAEEVTADEFRLFLRTLHRSGVTAKSDVIFVFDSSSSPNFSSVFVEEDDSFQKLLRQSRNKPVNSTGNSIFSFDMTQFLKSGKKDAGEPIWGKKTQGNFNDSGEAESTRFRYGSILGFETNELDPENSLSGFLDHVPMRLRRWACYPMLLGRVRRNFKHIMLADVGNSLIVGDPLVRVRNRSSESVYFYSQTPEENKHNKRNSEKTRSEYRVDSAILIGGARGIRRLSSAMLTEIVRAAMQHNKKKKNSVFESGILSQLVGNVHVLKNVNVIAATESIPGASSLIESRFSNSGADYSLILRGKSNHDVNSVIRKQICL